MTDRAYDRELAPLIPMLPTMADWSDMSATRAGMKTLLEGMPQDPELAKRVRSDDRFIPGPEGAPDVGVRVYQPVGAADGDVPRPAVLYIHGGGFCVGSVEFEHAGAAGAAAAADAIVVSVEYRLAPEDPYPAGLEDCYAALDWLAGNAIELGVDRERIAVMGGSAGGGLAAGLALLARDRGGPAICFQVLNIPELDDRLDTPSMREFVDTPLWNRPNAEISWRYYLAGQGTDVTAPGGRPNVEIYAAPARAEDLGGLPPAYVSTMEFDPLRDEGLRYAMRLLEHGVSVELHQFPGTFHGSAMFAEAGVSKRANQEMMAALARALRPLGADDEAS